MRHVQKENTADSTQAPLKDKAPPPQKEVKKAPRSLGFKTVGRGQIHLITTSPEARRSAGSTKIRRAFLVKDEAAFQALLKRVPKRYMSKGPSKKNPDPLLSHPPVDFKKHMLLVVEYDYMWQPPRVKKLLLTQKQILVHAAFAKRPRIMQHAYGAGSYVALKIPRSNHTPSLVKEN